jgi:hypothetical protein
MIKGPNLTGLPNLIDYLESVVGDGYTMPLEDVIGVLKQVQGGTAAQLQAAEALTKMLNDVKGVFDIIWEAPRAGNDAIPIKLKTMCRALSGEIESALAAYAKAKGA